MRQNDLPQAGESFLSAYSFPHLTFSIRAGLPGAIAPVWKLLARGDYARAAEAALAGLTSTRTGPLEERAALYVALAAGAFGSGNRKRAMAAAEESITLYPRQWAAHRVLLQVYWATGDFENAYFYLSTLQSPDTVLPWDEALPAVDRHVAISAMAWRLQDWDGVFDHLQRAYPAGPSSMPTSLREDAFRLGVYRDRAEEAAAAAEALLSEYGIAELDGMLRTLDSRGWAEDALRLYRYAYKRHAGSELLRRRMVGLCVRLGLVDEARSLTEGNALDLAA